MERTGKKAAYDAAVKAAAKLEEQLQSGEHASGKKMPWEQFRERYENDVGNAESSIKSDLAHLKAALRWAERMRLIPRAPQIEMPKRAGNTARGRPITAEEFERMLDKVEAGLLATSSRNKRSKAEAAKPKSARRQTELARAAKRQQAEQKAAADAPAYRRLLRGLWLSGLRLNEALNLYWDRDDRLRVDLSGRRPMLWIPAELDKGGKSRLLPITPDFAALLLETPEEQRRGRVFAGVTTSRTEASRQIASIGEAARVKIAEQNGNVQHATAHDMRRSFGERWAARVMPNVLQELMRHEHISTTMQFYVGRNAERTADILWTAAEGIPDPAAMRQSSAG